jgi:tRNA pseudouridine55 synthase
MFGCINIFKPAGYTSHDVVARVRRWYNFKKVGHLGTLDPAAVGVLPVCLGQATRLMEYFPDDKTYVATIELGRLTTTLDNEGETIEQENPPFAALSLEALQTLLQERFTGTISMRVPHHAAVHYNGKKLYHYAHSGIRLPEEELPMKETTLYSVQVLKLETTPTGSPLVELEVRCSTGTYIRSLARDLGRALGFCGGTLLHLCRSAHGQFTQVSSITMEELERVTTAGERPLENPARYLGMPLLAIQQPNRYGLLTHGHAVACMPGDPDLKANTKALALYQGCVVGVVLKVGAQWQPLKILNASVPAASAAGS